MPAGFPADIEHEAGSRPAGLGGLVCWCSAICFGVAAGIALQVWASPEFAVDFDGGTRTAHVSADIHLATRLLVAGVLSAIGSIVRGGGYRVRPSGLLLLLLVGPGVAVLTLPLLGYYG
ncbi:hypothetical protein QN239_23505 [Mycolicibacterium sp. Y3]